MSLRRDENYFNAAQNLDKYEKAWKYYNEDCERDGEQVVITFTDYMHMVPLSQVDRMIEIYGL